MQRDSAASRADLMDMASFGGNQSISRHTQILADIESQLANLRSLRQTYQLKVILSVMDYRFMIGQLQAVVADTAYDEVLVAEAPEAIVAPASGGSNVRIITSAELEQLAHRFDLTELIFDHHHGFIREIPCSTKLNQNHLAEISSTLSAFQMASRVRKESIIGHLAWLEWWTRWAITHCSRPGLRVSESEAQVLSASSR